MSSKSVKAKKALRQAAWHRSQTAQPITRQYPSAIMPLIIQNKDQQEKKRKLTPRQILTNYSYQDSQNKDKVFTVESEKLINNKMQQLLGYVSPLDVEYGEVLNRPGEPCWWR